MNRVILKMPEQTTVDASILPELYDAYLTTKAKSLSKAAIVNYKFALSPFLSWWLEHPEQHRHELTEVGFSQFFQWYECEFKRETGNPTSRYMLNKTAVNLQRFLKWAHQAGAVDRDLSALCPIPEYEQVNKFYPTNGEINALFENLEGVTRLRDAALFALAASTGARRMEIAAIEIESIEFFESPSMNDLDTEHDHSGYVHLRKVKGDSEGHKGGRYSVFDSVCGLLLKLYLHSIRRKAGSLFSLSDDGVRHVVNNNATKAGVFRMHPHAFRSAFIDLWAETNADIGHSP